jgi:cytoskeletal protein RodZ
MPPTLGQRLKHAREARGLSLRDVEHTTRIPVARLQDLEEDRLSTFGGLAYAKSFLRGYSALLDVNAEEVLNQMKPPPLGGARDYRYLVETQGPWITDRNELRASRTAAAPLTPGKSVVFVTVIGLSFAILIGGAVLANAYFHSKTAAAIASQNQATATATPSSTASSVSNSADDSGAYVSAEALPSEQASATAGTNRAFAPEPAVAKAIPVPSTGGAPPPKAEPVLEVVRKPLPPPPKAERVR